MIRNNTLRFGLVSITLHWLMAVLIIGLLIMGLYMVELPIGIQKLKFYGWHKEYGILVLMLVAIRLGWRLNNVVPALPTHLAKWQQWAARTVHFALYGFMILNPLTGWLLSSASGVSVSFFGLFVLPDLMGPNETYKMIFREAHEWLAFGLMGTICAHIGAALQHHFIYKDDTLRRMLP